MQQSIETGNSKPNWLGYPLSSRRSQGPKTAARWDALHAVAGLVSMLSHFICNSVMQTAAITERLSGMRLGRVLAGHEGLQ